MLISYISYFYFIIPFLSLSRWLLAVSGQSGIINNFNYEA